MYTVFKKIVVAGFFLFLKYDFKLLKNLARTILLKMHISKKTALDSCKPKIKKGIPKEPQKYINGCRNIAY